MPAKIYVETSIFSYLAARTSRDLIVAAHQEVTWDWWDNQRHQFDVCISRLVIQEVSVGDPEAVKRRLGLMVGLDIVEAVALTGPLSAALIAGKALPEKAQADAIHIALAACHRADYVLTWNFKHIANADTYSLIERIVFAHGLPMPKLCSPLQFSGDA